MSRSKRDGVQTIVILCGISLLWILPPQRSAATNTTAVILSKKDSAPKVAPHNRSLVLCNILCGNLTSSVREDDSTLNTPTKIKPAESWEAFRRKGNKRTGEANKKVRPGKNSKGAGQPVLPNINGPPGPPGPPGPQGPPGALVTEAAMMAEFRNLVRETATKRTRRIADQNISLMAAGIPDLLSAFHVDLRGNIEIPRKQHQEVTSYRYPAGQVGTFIRGNDVNCVSGRYTARYTGMYQFFANIIISRIPDARLRPKDCVKISICINSLCEHNPSLLAVTGLNSNSRQFTVSVSGLLMLKGGQYVSVYIENRSPDPITLMNKSSFSGHLIGS